MNRRILSLWASTLPLGNPDSSLAVLWSMGQFSGSGLNINCPLSTNSGNSPASIFLGTFPFQIAGCYQGNGSYNSAHAYLGLSTGSDEI